MRADPHPPHSDLKLEYVTEGKIIQYRSSSKMRRQYLDTIKVRKKSVNKHLRYKRMTHSGWFQHAAKRIEHISAEKKVQR